MANEIEVKVEDETIACAKCGKPMPAERLVLGLSGCKACTPQRKPLGAMIYSHKTGGVLEVTDNEEAFKKIKGSADDSVESL